jgi:hypothetical protein
MSKKKIGIIINDCKNKEREKERKKKIILNAPCFELGENGSMDTCSKERDASFIITYMEANRRLQYTSKYARAHARLNYLEFNII